MNIISEFQDYYDIGLSLGIDKSISYIRNQHESNGELLIPDLKANSGWGKPSWRHHVFSRVLRVPADFHSPHTGEDWAAPNGQALEAFFVGFCGKFYPMIRYRTKFGIDIETEYDYLYSESDVIGALDKSPFNHSRHRFRYGYGFHAHHGKTELELSLMFIRRGPIERIDPFVKLNAPIILLNLTGKSTLEAAVTTNIQLKGIKFFRCMDSYAAFQEISMFISGVLGVGEPEILEISDTDKRDSKGFNNSSFKKRPGKKRKQKR